MHELKRVRNLNLILPRNYHRRSRTEQEKGEGVIEHAGKTCPATYRILIKTIQGAWGKPYKHCYKQKKQTKISGTSIDRRKQEHEKHKKKKKARSSQSSQCFPPTPRAHARWIKDGPPQKKWGYHNDKQKGNNIVFHSFVSILFSCFPPAFASRLLPPLSKRTLQHQSTPSPVRHYSSVRFRLHVWMHGRMHAERGGDQSEIILLYANTSSFARNNKTPTAAAAAFEQARTLKHARKKRVRSSKLRKNKKTKRKEIHTASRPTPQLKSERT